MNEEQKNKSNKRYNLISFIMLGSLTIIYLLAATGAEIAMWFIPFFMIPLFISTAYRPRKDEAVGGASFFLMAVIHVAIHFILPLAPPDPLYITHRPTIFVYAEILVCAMGLVWAYLYYKEWKDVRKNG